MVSGQAPALLNLTKGFTNIKRQMILSDLISNLLLAFPFYPSSRRPQQATVFNRPDANSSTASTHLTLPPRISSAASESSSQTPC